MLETWSEWQALESLSFVYKKGSWWVGAGREEWGKLNLSSLHSTKRLCLVVFCNQPNLILRCASLCLLNLAHSSGWAPLLNPAVSFIWVAGHSLSSQDWRKRLPERQACISGTAKGLSQSVSGGPGCVRIDGSFSLLTLNELFNACTYVPPQSEILSWFHQCHASCWCPFQPICSWPHATVRVRSILAWCLLNSTRECRHIGWRFPALGTICCSLHGSKQVGGFSCQRGQDYWRIKGGKACRIGHLLLAYFIGFLGRRFYGPEKSAPIGVYVILRADLNPDLFLLSCTMEFICGDAILKYFMKSWDLFFELIAPAANKHT